MTYNDLHIGNSSSSWHLSIKIFVLGLFSAAIIKLTKNFWFRTGTFKRLIKKFNSIHADNIKMMGTLQGINISREEAIEGHIKTEKVLKKIVAFYHDLEGKKFFGNKQLEESIENALLSAYKLESYLNGIATAGVNCAEQDASLIEFSSDISLGSLQA